MNRIVRYGLAAGVLILAAGTSGSGDIAANAVRPAGLTLPDNMPAGYRVAIDPTTGAFVAPPANDRLWVLGDDSSAALESSQPLVARDNLIAGGKMAALDGRFRCTFVARVGDDCNMTLECETKTDGHNDDAGDQQ